MIRRGPFAPGGERACDRVQDLCIRPGSECVPTPTKAADRSAFQAAALPGKDAQPLAEGPALGSRAGCSLDPPVLVATQTQAESQGTGACRQGQREEGRGCSMLLEGVGSCSCSVQNIRCLGERIQPLLDPGCLVHCFMHAGMSAGSQGWGLALAFAV